MFFFARAKFVSKYSSLGRMTTPEIFFPSGNVCWFFFVAQDGTFYYLFLFSRELPLLLFRN
jgi:hypothetical protein